MAKKSVNQSPTSAGSPASFKPKPSVRMELSELPSGLPDITKPARFIIEGKVTKLSAPGGDFNDLACITLEPTSVKLAGDKSKKG